MIAFFCPSLSLFVVFLLPLLLELFFGQTLDLPLPFSRSAHH